MKRFNRLVRYMRIIGLCRKDNSLQDKSIGIIVNFVFMAIFLIDIVTTVWYFLFTAKTFAEYAESVYYILMALVIPMIYLTFLWQGATFNMYFTDLNSIIEARIQKSGVEKYYRKTHEIIEAVTKFCFVFGVGISTFVFIARGIISITTYIATDYSKESFVQTYLATYPFDWKTPSGYFFCMIIQNLARWTASTQFFGSAIITIGNCLFLIDFVSDIEVHMKEMNIDYVRMKNDCRIVGEDVKLRKRIFNVIKFHSESINFANRFTDLNSMIVFIYLASSTMIVCVVTLSIIASISDRDYVTVLGMAFAISNVISVQYIFCHIGDILTQRYVDVGTITYNLDWHLYPLDAQKCMLLMIKLAGRKVYLKGFGGIGCTRFVFKQLTGSFFKTFMILRNF